jgi:hypothetical protein
VISEGRISLDHQVGDDRDGPRSLELRTLLLGRLGVEATAADAPNPKFPG